jgi:hypothetical protein
MRLLAALIIVNGLLLAPVWVLAGDMGLPWLSLEAVVVVGGFALLPPRRWVFYGAVAAGVAVVGLALLGLGDTALRLSLGRPANLYVDLWLLDSVWHLLLGTLGRPLALVVVVLALGVTVVLALLVGRLLGPERSLADGPARPIEGADRPRRLRSGIADRARQLRGGIADRPRRLRILIATGLAGFVGAALVAERVPALAPGVDAPAVRLVRDQATRLVEMTRERGRFADALARHPDSYAGVPGLLSGLGGRDAIFAFVESYGVSALYDPRYAPVVGPRLDALEQRLEQAGLHLASGRVVAPSQGGQSWFGHGSLLSGIWLDNQLRYDMLLASGRETLIDDFERAGYRTVALMPAITAAWPEGGRFGYDEIFARGDIDYAGPPLNWVTMPDQFTWSFLERVIRTEQRAGKAGGDRARRPLFAELGLISSHAPWTPILPVLDDWDTIGDGAVFAAWKDAGESPEELWLDTDRVREHYGRSIEYALHTMAAYAERYVDERTLLVVLGDHQPAPLITGEDASWEVPVHVISGDAGVIQPFLEWGFVEGAWPDPEHEPLGVDHFRDWFVRTYSGS